MADLSAQSYDKLVTRMVNEEKLFEKYFKYPHPITSLFSLLILYYNVNFIFKWINAQFSQLFVSKKYNDCIDIFHKMY